MPRLRTTLLKEPWLGFDETPVYVSGTERYVHVAANATLVSHHLGQHSIEAAEQGGTVGVLQGTSVHDPSDGERCEPALLRTPVSGRRKRS